MVEMIPNRPMGRGGMAEKIANLDFVQSELRDRTERMARHARADLARHRDKGDASIEVSHPPKNGTRVDHYVILADERGDDAAMSIEYGHTTKGGKKVEGLHILQRATRAGGG